MRWFCVEPILISGCTRKLFPYNDQNGDFHSIFSEHSVNEIRFVLQQKNSVVRCWLEKWL